MYFIYIAVLGLYYICTIVLLIILIIDIYIVPVAKRTTVATDQNVIGGAIKWGRWRFGYNFSYFSIGFELSKCYDQYIYVKYCVLYIVFFLSLSLYLYICHLDRY